MITQISQSTPTATSSQPSEDFPLSDLLKELRLKNKLLLALLGINRGKTNNTTVINPKKTQASKGGSSGSSRMPQQPNQSFLQQFGQLQIPPNAANLGLGALAPPDAAAGVGDFIPPADVGAADRMLPADDVVPPASDAGAPDFTPSSPSPEDATPEGIVPPPADMDGGAPGGGAEAPPPPPAPMGG